MFVQWTYLCKTFIHTTTVNTNTHRHEAAKKQTKKNPQFNKYKQSQEDFESIPLTNGEEVYLNPAELCVRGVEAVRGDYITVHPGCTFTLMGEETMT